MRSWRPFTFLGLAGGLLALALGNSAVGQDKVDLKVGDAAPTFASTDDGGKAWKSADHVGRKVVVVYFFPAALTGG